MCIKNALGVLCTTDCLRILSLRMEGLGSGSEVCSESGVTIVVLTHLKPAAQLREDEH